MQYRNHIRSHRSSRSARSGFTLLELLLVLAILVMIIGIGVTNFSGVQDGANVSATEVTLEGLQGNVKMYKIRMNGLPENLEMLRDGPTDAAKKAKWVAAIIDEIPKDSWDNDLEYNVSGGSFELRSSGLDQQMNTDDDITVEGS
ncbi:type II secretion system protein GspG [Rubripirellula sp.]|nr:type II secretion system protein GspG [Rubripirellula sp.]MDB4749356.1 type II secretion system protein GspG [Rubripirellula sp.]